MFYDFLFIVIVMGLLSAIYGYWSLTSFSFFGTVVSIISLFVWVLMLFLPSPPETTTTEITGRAKIVCTIQTTDQKQTGIIIQYMDLFQIIVDKDSVTRFRRHPEYARFYLTETIRESGAKISYQLSSDFYTPEEFAKLKQAREKERLEITKILVIEKKASQEAKTLVNLN